MVPLPFLVLGDSLADGVALHLPRCAYVVHVGISPAGFLVHHGAKVNGPPWAAPETTVISLGSNPGPSVEADEGALRALRAKAQGRVVWLLPPARMRAFVTALARSKGDMIVDVRDGGAGPGHIHPSPAGYAHLAREVELASTAR